MTKAKQKYRDQRRDAVKRNISFDLTFNDWYHWWLDKGIDKNADTNHSLCMCRFNDAGSYSLNNIYLATRSQNTKDAWQHRNHSFKFKRIQTPAGVFESRKAAAAFYNVDPSYVSKYVKLEGNSFYYID